MKGEDIFNLKGNSPVILKDKKMGILIRWPADDNLCGIQVPGEEDIRWINIATLIDMGNGALEEMEDIVIEKED